jgi:hypothetical protein
MNEDFEPIEDMLRRNREEPSAEERRRIEQRVTGEGRQEPAGARRPRRRVAPRLAFTAAAATGALMLGGGATFAMTGFDDPLSAAGAQYPTVGTQTVGGIETPPEEEDPTTGQGEDDPVSTGGGEPAPAAAQAQEQTELAATGELPFTGLMAIPLLVVGLVLLVGGMVLRGRTSGTESG